VTNLKTFADFRVKNGDGYDWQSVLDEERERRVGCSTVREGPLFVTAHQSYINARLYYILQIY